MNFINKTPTDQYLELMKIIRFRFDSIHVLTNLIEEDFSKSEIAAFHGRKIIEAIAFGCLIGINNGLKSIPRDLQGQYNAEKIIKNLIRKKIEIFPSPSEIRKSTKEELEKNNVNIVIEGIIERRITPEELVKKYQRMHQWLHELNPYTKENHLIFNLQNQKKLWNDLEEIENFIKKHVMSLNGEAFYCTLRDSQDGNTKVISLTKTSNY